MSYDKETVDRLLAEMESILARLKATNTVWSEQIAANKKEDQKD